jgi:hemerythrin-like domain-containing protein
VKRNAALASLSRDHPQVLVVARRLSRASNQTAAEARQAFARYWMAHGRRHLRLEEEVLLPSYAAYGDSRHPVVLRALGDHVEIRQNANALAGDAEVLLGAIHEAGAKLAAHVRLEERELFPMIERTMPPGELIAVARKLERLDLSRGFSQHSW